MRTRSESYWLVAISLHLVADGYSLNVFFGSLMASYTGADDELPRTPG